MQRISVVGNSGSGKSRLARAISDVLGIPYVELDAIHHLANWQPIDPEEFDRRVTEIAATPSWVIDGNYRSVVQEGAVWRRAEFIVWLDLPRRVVMRQVIMRTFSRVIRRTELWNGNREPFGNLWRWDPSRSIIRWAWTQHKKYDERYTAAMASPELEGVCFVRLRSHRQARDFLQSLGDQPLSSRA